jgi:hypothetical protein
MSGAKLEVFSKEVSAGDLIAAIERDGGAIVEDMADANSLQQINAELDAFIVETAPGVRYSEPSVEESIGKRGSIDFDDIGVSIKDASPKDIEVLANDFYGTDTVRIDGLPGKSASFVEYMCHPLLLSVADHFLLPNCYHYTLNTGQLIEIRPGEDDQVLHRDEGAWFPSRG